MHTQPAISRVHSLAHFSGASHDDVIKWKHFPRCWPFVRGIHRSSVNSPHKGQWRGALIFSLICVWIDGWVKNREAGDLRRYRAHYDVSVMHWECTGVCHHAPCTCYTCWSRTAPIGWDSQGSEGCHIAIVGGKKFPAAPSTTVSSMSICYCSTPSHVVHALVYLLCPGQPWQCACAPRSSSTLQWPTLSWLPWTLHHQTCSWLLRPCRPACVAQTIFLFWLLEIASSTASDSCHFLPDLTSEATLLITGSYKIRCCLALVTMNSFVNHYNDVIMGTIASQITSLTTVYSTIYIKENIKAPRHWRHGPRWIPRTNGQ